MQLRAVRILALSLALAAAATAAGAFALARLGLRLRIDHDVAVHMPAALNVRAAISRPLAVTVDERLAASVRLRDLAIPLDETIEVPLRLTAVEPPKALRTVPAEPQ